VAANPTPQSIRPPNPQEAILLQNWLDVSKATIDELEKQASPWSEYLNDFCEIVYDILHPEEAG
jgi:hypothetical protein